MSRGTPETLLMERASVAARLRAQNPTLVLSMLYDADRRSTDPRVAEVDHRGE